MCPSLILYTNAILKTTWTVTKHYSGSQKKKCTLKGNSMSFITTL